MAKRKSEASSSTPGDPPMAPKEDLPPKRQGKAVKRTSAPLSKAPMNNFIYSLAAVALFVAAFYTWRLMAWKQSVGGWWNLAMGRPPLTHTGSGGKAKSGGSGSGDSGVEAKISELASALGIPPATLATAIASAVSEHVPPATLSSIAKNEAPTASVVKSLVDDPDAEATASANSFKAKVGNVVGFDEPDIGLD